VGLFERVVAAVRAGADGAVPGVPVSDTVKVVEDGRVVETLDRARLVAVQTPQAFAAGALRQAHEDAADATDCAALVEAAGGQVVVVDGEDTNAKITTQHDLDVARALIGHA
jgi:2-C-methyl-D-erythritol 4-phosphate cytidylyltransferase